MRAVVQRVKNASVTVEGTVTGSLIQGLLVYIGVARDDAEKDAEWMAEKIVNLRIFEDDHGKMNLSLLDIASREKSEKIGILAISQFTLLAETSRGRRPFYGEAAEPEKAKTLYENFMTGVKERGMVCEAGTFQAHMEVTYTNDGPVTIILNSPI